jgi:predicted transcriptional regulator
MDQIVRILESAIGGATKTNLMYKAFVSSQRLSDYLNLLMLSGFLRYDKLDFVYTTTANGMNFLNTVKQIQRVSFEGSWK